MRGRKPSPERSQATNLHLPESVRARLDLLLYSEFEGRIPKGAYQRFFLARLADFFEGETLDLAPYTGAPPDTLIVRGLPHAITTLKQLLESQP